MSTTSEAERGGDEDGSGGGPDPLLEFLDRWERMPDAGLRRRRSYELLGPLSGARVADIGCGAGTAARELAGLVGPGGSVVGVDVNAPLLDRAAARARKEGVEVAFRVGTAEALPFEAGSLDGYRAERLYQHLARPAEALAEARRVLAPGGRIVIVDVAWDALLLDSEDRARTRAILRAWADGTINPAACYGQHRQLGDAGFTDARVEVAAVAATSFSEYSYLPELIAQVLGTTGAVESKTVEAWLEDQRERGRQGRFFAMIPYFLSSARR